MAKQVKQEYLFVEDTHKAEIESYKPENVRCSIQNIEDSTCWIAVYEVSGENLQSAKILSKTNDYITSEFNPTILTNESAAYFNKSLYPYFNEFERKLRKLLYLKSALQHDATASQNIKELESKDLGTIFELLFTDAQFIKDVKKSINEKSWQFTREEIINTINRLSENTLWDSLIGHETISILRSDFIRVKNYRNDVMHAHNMDAASYTSALGVIKKINDQLDDELNKLVKSPETPTESSEKSFNSALSQALEEYQSSLRRAYSPEMLSSTLSSYQNAMREIDVTGLTKAFADSIASDYTSELKKSIEQMTFQNSSISTSLASLANAINQQKLKIDFPSQTLSDNVKSTITSLGEKGELNIHEQAENADPRPDHSKH